MKAETSIPAKKQATDETQVASRSVLEFKRRMLEWPNPVEFVNNMYGSHPAADETDYFTSVFKR